jgi:hypothetical protein
MVQRAQGIFYLNFYDSQQVNVEHRMLGDVDNVFEAEGSNTPESSSINAQDVKV